VVNFYSQLTSKFGIINGMAFPFDIQPEKERICKLVCMSDPCGFGQLRRGARFGVKRKVCRNGPAGKYKTIR
jgi:hypothetical protein